MTRKMRSGESITSKSWANRHEFAFGECREQQQREKTDLNDVRVPIAFEDLDLAGHALHVGDLHNTLLLEDLDSHLLARDQMQPQLNLAERALTDRVAQHILAHDLATAVATVGGTRAATDVAS
jgi:hypothetical protein